MAGSRARGSAWVPVTVIVAAGLVALYSAGVVPSGLRAGHPTTTGRPQAVVVPSNVAPSNPVPTPNPMPTDPPVPTSTPMATFAAAAQGPTAVAGQWLYPDSTGPVLGLSGPLLRFRVAVEQGLSVTVP
jgi:hypothetical protein